MESAYVRACAVADIWASSVLRAFRMSDRSDDASWTAELSRKIQSIKFLVPTPPPPAGTPKELVHLVSNLSPQYPRIHPNRLMRRWEFQAELFGLVKQAREGEVSRESNEGECLSGQEVGLLRNCCLHYANLLKERSRTAVYGGVMARSITKLVNGRDTNQEIDLEIADHLVKIAECLTVSESPPPTRNASPTALEWLFATNPEFHSAGYWPVPAIYQFNSQFDEPGRSVPDAASNERGGVADLPTLMQDLVTNALQAHQTSERQILSFWTELLKPYLLHQVPQPDAALAKLVSEFHAGVRHWTAGTEAWASRCLQTTATLLSPEVEIIPSIREDGSLDWESLGDDELVISDHEESETEVRFGIRGKSPAQVAVSANDLERKKWLEWSKMPRLDNPELHASFLEQRTRYCSGTTVSSLRKVLTHLAEDQAQPAGHRLTDEGGNWLHHFVESGRGDPARQQAVRELLASSGLEIFPRLTPKGDPVWSRELERAGVGDPLPGSLLSGLGAEHRIHAVHMFATSAEKCRFTYTRPVDVRFKRLAEIIQKSQPKLDQELLAGLDSIYQQVVSGTRAGVSAEFQQLFLRVIQTLDQLAQREKLDRIEGSALLEEIRTICEGLESRLELLPSSYSLCGDWECPDETCVEITYRYDEDVRRKQVIEVTEFGLRSGSLEICPASVVISVGKSPEGYEELLTLLPDLEQRLGLELGQLLRDLPRLEVVENRPEQLFTDLFKLLWPTGPIATVRKNNADEMIQLARTWYSKAVKERQLLLIRSPKKGENLQNERWRLADHYDEANQGHGYSRGDMVEEVVRPLLTLFKDREVREVVKLKAVIYVTDY